MADVGISIFEGVSAGQTPYRDPSKRNIGLLGEFTRGVPFIPSRVESLEEFTTMFGGPNYTSFGPAIVRSIFMEAQNAPVTLYISRVVGEGALASTVFGYLDESGEERIQIDAAQKGKKDPGVWGDKITAKFYSFGLRVKGMFSLVIEYDGEVVEIYDAPTSSEIQNRVNKLSKYVVVEFSKEVSSEKFKFIQGMTTFNEGSTQLFGTGTNYTGNFSPGDEIYTTDYNLIGVVESVQSDSELQLTSPAKTSAVETSILKRLNSITELPLAGGSIGALSIDSYNTVHDSRNPRGWACFDGVDVQILACTEYHSLEMAKMLNQYLNTTKGPIGVVNLPLNSTDSTAELYASELQTSGVSFLAGAYSEWCKIPDELGNPILIPVIGPVLGAAYIRSPYLQGDYVHIPPAGVDSLFSNVIEVTPDSMSQATINKLVTKLSCNVLQKLDNIGYYVGSSRSYSTNALYSSIHIRLQTSYYVRALKNKLRFLEQKPNSPELKREALVELNRFFRTEWENGALERGIPFEKAYQGISDKSNNPPTQDRKQLNITCLYIPSECTEQIRIDLQRNDRILLTLETE